jgi:glycosyltransferase involved in cell wall biosynthesis
MTKGLDEIGVSVAFVLPMSAPVGGESHVRFRTASQLSGVTQTITEQVTNVFEHVSLHQVPAVLEPYQSPATRSEAIRKLISLQLEHSRSSTSPVSLERLGLSVPDIRTSAQAFVKGVAPAQYTGDLMGQVQNYAALAIALAKQDTFDVIHAHDWMTYPAGIAVAAITGKPLVVHVHSTEFDRSGENVNQQVYDIERAGMHSADAVVCVSYLTRNIAITRYGVDPAKIEVVYNATELPSLSDWQLKPIRGTEKIVLFLGRMTMQKGPEYFLRAAKKVVEKFTDVRFVMAGSGDMITRCIEEAAALGIGRYVTFTGFLRGKDVDRVFSMADLYVMPSVSEPFGIAPLEALSHNVPVMISKQSGVSEVLTHALKVDFWDIEEMANKILAVLRHPPLQRTLRQHGQIELRKLSWKESAIQLKGIYERLVQAPA